MAQESTARNLEFSPSEVLVRGILEHVLGPGGETTGKAISLDHPLNLEKNIVWSIEVDGVKDPAAFGKYVQAEGSITYRKGVERPFWPVLDISELKLLKIDGRAKKSLAQIEVILTVQPPVFTWTNIAGLPEPSPKITYSVHNGSRSDLNLTFPTTAQVCFVVRDAATKKELWKHPEISGNMVTHLKIDPGKTFSETIELPKEAAPHPGIYVMDVSFCSHDEFDLTTRFEVAVS